MIKPSENKTLSAEHEAASLRSLFPKLTLIRLLIAWSVVVVFAIWGKQWLAEPFDNTIAVICFMVLFATIVMASFGVVGEADHLAHQLGEPYGTLILTLSIVSIEVILIASVLLGPGEFPTIGRDAIFSVMMIILNLVTGLCLLVGGLRYREQEYNAQGSVSYLSLITMLTGLALVLPNYVSGAGEFNFIQAIAFSAITIVVYAVFLWMQIGNYSRLFVQPVSGCMAVPAGGASKTVQQDETPSVLDKRAILIRSVLLIAMILPIVLLAHDLAILIDYGIETVNAPVALGGVLIAIIVFTPESITAVKAALNNEMQRAINLCLGAFVSTVGLTVPAVLIIGLVMNKTVTMGISGFETILFLLTVALTAFSFIGQRTSPIQGVLHLALFAVFSVLLFSA